MASHKMESKRQSHNQTLKTRNNWKTEILKGKKWKSQLKSKRHPNPSQPQFKRKNEDKS